VRTLAYADKALEGWDDYFFQGSVLHIQSQTMADGLNETNVII